MSALMTATSRWAMVLSARGLFGDGLMFREQQSSRHRNVGHSARRSAMGFRGSCTRSPTAVSQYCFQREYFDNT
jgi:hypothetical protein